MPERKIAGAPSAKLGYYAIPANILYSLINNGNNGSAFVLLITDATVPG